MQTKRRFIVPEIVQTSAMDCGPASLAALMAGMGIATSYGRLREACQTDVDGTSIDTMEEIAVQLGLDAEQVMIPVDHLLLEESEALPAIVVVRLPNGFTHFVVAWRVHGSRVVQVMDPATGRRWPTVTQFLQTVYEHTFPVPADGWFEWASSDEFLKPLRRRLQDLGVAGKQIDVLLETHVAEWMSLACLDAAVRLTGAVVASGGIKKGREATSVLQATLAQAAAADDPTDIISPAYWHVTPAPTEPDEDLHLYLRGAVLVRAKGCLAHEERPLPEQLSPELAATLTEEKPQPLRQLYQLVCEDGLPLIATILLCTLLSSIGVVVEWLLLRGLVGVGQELGWLSHRLGAITAVFLFLLIIFFVQLNMTHTTLRMGRHIEVRLRIAFLEKIPKLRDQYFHSRPNSDMAQRSHSVYRLRNLPMIGLNVINASLTLLITTIALIWLSPASTLLILLAAIVALGVPLLLYPLLLERDMRMRTHTGALSRFFLDGMLGLVPIRTHGATKAVRREHESLLGQWAGSAFSLHRMTVTVQGVQTFLGFSIAILILFNYLANEASTVNLLLLVYWVLMLPMLGEEIAMGIRQYPSQRNIALRLLEPLGAPEDDMGHGGEAPFGSHNGVALALHHVTVRAAGHIILEDIDLKIAAGEHVAIVGASGAGKSTLASLFLGWQRALGGEIRLNGVPFTAPELRWLRQHTAWVDPAIQLWNRSFLKNLNYGNSSQKMQDELPQIIEQADLLTVLRKLPQGLQTPLGEGGGLVSGGEGQRVRLGRAMLRSDVKLVLLDEPFRGLDRQQRHDLLIGARQLWQDATLLCITHDILETESFDRVLVLENGKLVEDGCPSELAAQENGRYHALLQAEQTVQSEIWESDEWRRWYLTDGEVQETGKALAGEAAHE